MFEILKQGCHGLVNLTRHHAVAFFQIAMLVPWVGDIATTHLVAATGEFHKAHATLDKPPGHKALARILGELGIAIVDAIHLFCGLALVLDVGELGHGFLHQIGRLGVFDRILHGVVSGGAIRKLAIKAVDEIQRAALLLFE